MNNIFSNYYNKLYKSLEKKNNSIILELNKIYWNTLLYKSINMIILDIDLESTDSWNYYKDMNYL
tara:strand:+ start:198 stop:392 length:195 start_codon:yes stop_codon:yes gene_type:complete